MGLFQIDAPNYARDARVGEIRSKLTSIKNIKLKSGNSKPHNMRDENKGTHIIIYRGVKGRHL